MRYVNEVAETHDLRYGLAQTEADVRTADNMMVQLIAQGRRSGKDTNFKLNQADLITAKILMEDILGVPKAWFATATAAMYQNKLNKLQQQGFGASGQGIHERNAKSMPMSILRALPVAVRKSKNG